MHTPIELKNGCDVFSPEVEALVRSGRLLFLWLAPPCSSFSALRNIDPAGPLRPKDLLYGDPLHPRFHQAQLGNRLWRRALFLARTAILGGMPVTIEHPRASAAWRLPCTKRFRNQFALVSHKVDWCMYSEQPGPRKPTTLCSNMPWLARVLRTCDHSHQHVPLSPGQGSRITDAAKYPNRFCHELALSCCAWFHDVR